MKGVGGGHGGGHCPHRLDGIDLLDSISLSLSLSFLASCEVDDLIHNPVGIAFRTTWLPECLSKDQGECESDVQPVRL